MPETVVTGRLLPMLIKLYRFLNRRKVTVAFNDLSVARPVSSVFGLDRGTPIDRYYIEKFLARNALLIRGRVLEVGDSEYTRRFGAGRVKASEVLHARPGNPEATWVGDLTDPSTLPSNSFDCFLCTHTLNCIFDVRQAVLGAHQVLKPGGVLIATLPGVGQISRYDMDRWGDFWRFTTAAAESLFQPVFAGEVEVASHGNVLAAISFLQGLAVEDLPDPALLDEHDPEYQLVVTILARKA